MKPINLKDIENNKYMLSCDDDYCYLLKHKGEVIISPERAQQWLDAGIYTQEGKDTTQDRINYLLEKKAKEKRK